MTLDELDKLLSGWLDIPAFPNDPSKNGVQVAHRPGTEIRKIAFAVDACLETIRRAAAQKADVLFVHHGFLWGDCEPVTGIYYERVRALIENNLALYACHLPLDANPDVGNNYGIARMLGLENVEPCCEWRGYKIGVIGDLAAPLPPQEILSRLFPSAARPVVLPFGKEKAAKAAIVSGGGSDEVPQAAAAGADVFITGEIHHEMYHTAEEMGISVIAAGHYLTETVGVGLLKKKLGLTPGIETVFIEEPTGL